MSAYDFRTEMSVNSDTVYGRVVQDTPIGGLQAEFDKTCTFLIDGIQETLPATLFKIFNFFKVLTSRQTDCLVLNHAALHMFASGKFVLEA